MEENGGNNKEDRKRGNNKFFVVILAIVLLAVTALFIFISQPKPSVSATTEASEIKRGETVTLTWSSSKTEILYLSTIPATENILELDLQGSMEVSPQETTRYIFTATRGRHNVVAEITVTVVEPLPVIEAKVEPSRIIRGQKAVLSWKATDASIVEIDGIARSLTGNLEVSPKKTITYTFRATGLGGEVFTTVEVRVFDPPPVYIVDKKFYETAVWLDVKHDDREYWVVSLEVPAGTLIRAPSSGEFYIVTAYRPPDKFGDRVMPGINIDYPSTKEIQRYVSICAIGLIVKNQNQRVEAGDVIAKIKTGRTGRIFVSFGEYITGDVTWNDEETFYVHFPWLFNGK
ncbi:MAG: hypothetical protein DDT42_01239 [candidate division WS2 bacterium]|uniref:Uncharacterized protein n=1 Tax=Psychracetigena formicireducens TaxID=2986056 RepID=A0A9E2BGY4_PSYF1|nr:hypothetical protein [Candidatus Psychracetigena formicireducens]